MATQLKSGKAVRPATAVLSLHGHPVTAETLGLIVAFTPHGCANYFEPEGDERWNGESWIDRYSEQKKWLRATTHGLLTRFSRWRRRVKIALSSVVDSSPAPRASRRICSTLL